MTQSPQILYALARQQDRIDPPRTVIDRALDEPIPGSRPEPVSESRVAWFWQLLAGRRETVAS